MSRAGVRPLMPVERTTNGRQHQRWLQDADRKIWVNGARQPFGDRGDSVRLSNRTGNGGEALRQRGNTNSAFGMSRRACMQPARYCDVLLQRHGAVAGLQAMGRYGNGLPHMRQSEEVFEAQAVSDAWMTLTYQADHSILGQASEARLGPRMVNPGDPE